MAGLAKGTILQGKPGSVAEGSDPGESEPYRGRVGQKMRELRKKLLRKWQARDRGEETGSDDDNDDEVAADMEWDVLEDEDTLTDAHWSM